jgi:DNA-binding CsgD family transcriptional regulator/tetratricopeptide (TPR) repeat protein
MGGFATGAGGGGLLERSPELNALDFALAAVTSSGQGRIVLVAGEAGIGKTALLRQFTAGAAGSTRVLWARCEPLFTPRPLGPVLELADAIGSEAAVRAVGAGTPYDVAMGIFPELATTPSVVVFEDVHWADEATLDVVRLFARRAADAAVLLVLSYREDELDQSHPLRVVLGNLPGGGLVSSLSLAGLSARAVAALAGPGYVDAAELYRRTDGNPFYVTEVLAAGTATIPRSVRDAVLARTVPLRGPARDLLEAASVVPGAVEAWLLTALVPTAAEVLDECLGTGVLVLDGDRVEFRHEIARQVVQESLRPGRRSALHRIALMALASRPAEDRDLARLAHHADAAGDAEAVLEYAPAAAARAVSAGAYREAARLYDRALRFAELLTPDRHAALLERFAEAAYYTELGREAADALRKVVAIHAEHGNVIRQGDALRRLGDQLGRDGALAESTAAITEAVALLERQPPGRELARAYNAMAAVTGIIDDDGAVLWGKKALEVGEQVGCLEEIGDTLSLIGTAELRAGNLGGLEKLEQSREIARQAGDERGVAASFARPAATLAGRREWLLAGRYISDGRDFCRDRGLESFYGWLTAVSAEEALARGRWDEAVRTAAEILGMPVAGYRTLRITALLVTATVRARRGEPGYEPLLAEAVTLGQDIPPGRHAIQIAALRAELAWLAGTTSRWIAEEADSGPAVPFAVRWFAGETEAWRHRAGLDSGDAADLPVPYRMEITGDADGAARWWHERGCAYDAALALGCSGDRLLMRRALDILLDLGAQPAVAVVTRQLRALGEQGLRRGPRSATAASTAGLTSRETEVLTLLADGLSNTEIATQLVLSGRTVDNHTAAIFRKLGVRNREAARAAAQRLGLARD